MENIENKGKQVPLNSGQVYPGLPVLCRLPNMTNDLTMKISHNGVTMPKTGKYKRRYTGGGSVIDANGKLHLTKKAFIEYCRQEEIDRQAYKDSLNGISKKKSGRITKKLPEKTNISEGVKVEKKSVPVKNKMHVVNKTEVNNRLQSICNALFSSQKKNAFLGMLTVSFPPSVNDDIAAQALNTWLTALRQKGRRVVRQYLWVSERQKVGTIHYHMLILNRVNIVYVNRAMKVVLCNLVRSGVIDYPLAAMKRYNGVDLAKDRKTRVVTNFCDPKSRKALFYYITKYVTKNNESFDHAAWNCSRGFSALFTAMTCTYEEFIKMSWENNAMPDPVINSEWFMFFPWQKDTGPPPVFVQHLAAINGHILAVRGFLN